MFRQLGFQRAAAPKQSRIRPLRTLRCESLEARRMLSVYYVDATGGNDSWNGRAGAYVAGTTGPWQTVQKVNSETQAPGDSVLFKCGEVWREALAPDSGDAGGDVTYGAYSYGSGGKPQILGSVELNSTSDWNDLGSNIWGTDVGTVTTDGSELLGNPSFATNTSGWWFSTSSGGVASGYRDTTVYDSAPAGYSIACTDSGTSPYSVRLVTSSSMGVTEGEYYLLSFRAKSTIAFSWSNKIEAFESAPSYPIWGKYAMEAYSITTSWETYNVLFQATTTTATGARFSFLLGKVLPDGATFSIDTMSFKHCELSSEVLGQAIGNIIYDGASCGVAEWSLDGLDAQGDFFYDTSDWTVKVYSTANPASYYSDIELAQTRDCVNYNGGSYITFEDLDLRYSSASGTDGAGVDHLTIRGLDVSFMGGGVLGFWWHDGSPLRFGNGIDFYGDASYILVEDCKVWEIYDAGLSNQSSAAAVEHDIVYRNNVVWNCEYSYEYFVSGEEGTVYNIYFENNTCLYAGYGWGNAQRLNPVGWNLKLRSLADTNDFYIRNNIFYEASGALVGLWGWTDLDELMMDNNLLYSSDNNYASWNWGTYTSFASYQTVSGKDANSIAANPEFADAANLDFHLESTSPAINNGIDTGIAYDYDGISRPQNTYYDIGAYEVSYRLPGDANGDGTVNQGDAVIVSANWLMPSGASWGDGDFNGDQQVDDRDATIMAANWTRPLPLATSFSAATEPEVETFVSDPEVLPGDATGDSTEPTTVSYDLDNSGKVDLGDLSFFATVYREKPGITTESPYAYAADFDRSGTVDLGDLALFAANYQLVESNDSFAPAAEASQSSLAAPVTAFTMAAIPEMPTIMPGDANRDGRVDDHDAGMVARNWQAKKRATWSDGDFNGDEIINDQDAVILAQHWMMTNDDMDDKAHDEAFATIGVAESDLFLSRTG